MAVRIVFITHYAELYGANRSMLDLLLELSGRGEIVPHVLLPKGGPLTERLAASGIPFAIVPWQPWMSERHYMGRMHHRLGQYLRYERAARTRAEANEAALPNVLEQLRAWKAEVVHVNSAAVGITALLQRAIDVPLIWHIRELPERQYLLHIDEGRRRYGTALHKADRVIAISEAVRRDIRRYAGVTMPTELIYNGVLTLADYKRLSLGADERWASPSPFTFLLAGLIHPSKGQEEAIRAFARVHKVRPDTRLLLVGGGKADHLLTQVQDLGLSQVVRSLGFVEDPTPLFQQSHALLMCSRNEAMGRVTVEAMGCGLPVIGHASGGTLELVEDKVTGLVYPGGDEELADRMLALANDPARARALGTKAMALAVERFSVERYASEVLEVYRSVLSPSAR